MYDSNVDKNIVLATQVSKTQMLKTQVPQIQVLKTQFLDMLKYRKCSILIMGLILGVHRLF